jgi:TPP-dependent pyruvate/acetoin dehydrogenase alpha subunit
MTDTIDTTGTTARLSQFLAGMARIRHFEERVAELHAAGKIVGSVHLCIGQEAIYAGAAPALSLPADKVFATYRGHGWAIACGVPLDRLFAELMGREAGINGGRGGSAFLTAPAFGFLGENSIVGGAAPIATGAAMAAEFDGSGRVVLCSFGEGAMNQGAVHEALNFAAIRRAPVIFVIENNTYSELTPTSSMVRIDSLYRRASAYGIRGARIDGNDPEAVYQAIRHAAQEARAGNGPVVIEAMTQRLVGHYIGDAQLYRPAGEIDAARARDPIAGVRRALLESGASEALLSQLTDRVSREVDEAAALAARAPLADAATVEEHLYA